MLYFVKQIKRKDIMALTNIKSWYLKEYSDDEIGKEINPKATFKGLFIDILNVYDYLNVCDSLVRERVFSELAKRMNVDYSVVYNKWLNIAI